MILKVMSDENNHTLFDSVKWYNIYGRKTQKYLKICSQIKGEWEAYIDDPEDVPKPEIFFDSPYEIDELKSKRLKNLFRGENDFPIMVIKRVDDSIFYLTFSGIVYVMNDSGKTIETLDTIDYWK